jgi:hypothetical protein
MPAPSVMSKLKCLRETISYITIKINKPIRKHRNQPRELIRNKKKKRRLKILNALVKISNTINDALNIQETNEKYITQLCEENKSLSQIIENLLPPSTT